MSKTSEILVEVQLERDALARELRETNAALANAEKERDGLYAALAEVGAERNRLRAALDEINAARYRGWPSA